MEITITLQGLFNFASVILSVAVMGFVLYRAIEKALHELDKRMSTLEVEMKSDTKRLESEFKSGFNILDMKIGALSERVNNLSERVNRLSEKVNHLSDRVDHLSDRMSANEGKLDAFIAASKAGDAADSLHKTASPVILTQKGLDIAEKTNARALVEKYADSVAIPDAAGKLDIQEQCFNFAMNDLLNAVSADERTTIRDAIYDEGGEARKALMVYGILFRDAFLAKMGWEAPQAAA